MNTSPEKKSILRRQQVETRTGLSRSTIYLLMQKGIFPKSVKLGPRAVGWVEGEIEAWLASCVEKRDIGQEVR